MATTTTLHAEVFEAKPEPQDPYGPRQFIAHVYDGKDIYDACSFKSFSAARDWVERFYGITAEVK